MIENQITETTLRGETTGSVKELRGFLAFHREPDDCGPRARRFVQLAGSQDVADRAAQLFDGIRRTFGYKRRELTLTCDEGGASIKTPDFDATLTLIQDPEFAARYRLTIELSGFRREQILESEEFAALFNAYCDTAAIAFARPIDLKAKIDQIEEHDDLAALLDYDASCSWLTLRLPRLVIEVTRWQMTFKLPEDNNLRELIGQTRTALTRLAGAGVVLEETESGLSS